ncbi:hypothetical protein H9P43_004705 [Blastocladiella emersonii ATCC 22665]|nr:hypothetical protein H9P43_004705 [Blastocladiella emersonii ATCC 22665]
MDLLRLRLRLRATALALAVLVVVFAGAADANTFIRRIRPDTETHKLPAGEDLPSSAVPLVLGEGTRVTVPIAFAVDDSAYPSGPVRRVPLSDAAAWVALPPGDEESVADLRVSWPASTPVDIDYALFRDCRGSKCTRLVRLRGVWDTYTRRDAGEVPGAATVYLVYERAVLGVLPATAVPLIPLLAVVVGVAALVVVPRVLRLVDEAVLEDNDNKGTKSE